MDDVIKAWEMIASAEGVICVASHVKPDGDAIGSAQALAGLLRNMGKDVVVRIPEPRPLNYAFLDTDYRINEYVNPADVGLLIVVDVANLARVGGAAEGLGHARTIIIDHHLPHDGATANFDAAIVWPEASSTAEMLYRLFHEWGVTGYVTPEVATAAYVGLLTDTGSFRHSNVDSQAYEAAAGFCVWGADVEFAANEVYKSNRIEGTWLRSKIGSTFRQSDDGRVAWGYSCQEFLDETGGTPEEAYSMVGEIGSLKGPDVTLFFQETETPGVTRLSARSRSGFDCDAFCSQWGGGGHKPAAGASIKKALGDAMSEAVMAAERLLVTPHVNPAAYAPGAA